MIKQHIKPILSCYVSTGFSRLSFGFPTCNVSSTVDALAAAAARLHDYMYLTFVYFIILADRVIDNWDGATVTGYVRGLRFRYLQFIYWTWLWAHG